MIFLYFDQFRNLDYLKDVNKCIYNCNVSFDRLQIDEPVKYARIAVQALQHFGGETISANLYAMLADFITNCTG